MLTCGGHDSWIAEELLEKRMWVATDDYRALHACIENDAVDVCKLLLDGGMNFEGFRQWAKDYTYIEHKETMKALAAHWSEMQAEPEQAPDQEIGGQTFG